MTDLLIIVMLIAGDDYVDIIDRSDSLIYAVTFRCI
jgi:hypothetical protein